MRIAVMGTGYVGLVVGTCLAEWGHEVICIDQNPQKITKLQQGNIPIYEPGLAELVAKNLKKRSISFSDQIEVGIETAECIFICVGTPPQPDGSAHIGDVCAVAQSIGAHMRENKLVIIKSTVPIGTAERIRQIILNELEKRNSLHLTAYMVSNPEFLREGEAVQDFMEPDRIVIGTDHAYALHKMKEIYAPLEQQGFSLIEMDIASAELTKYAANAMLASRISFMNEIAALCEGCGADIEHIRRGIARDKRIGSAFLGAGIGYGGSCFPKDVKALIYNAAKLAIDTPLLRAIEQVNQRQKSSLALKVQQYFKAELSQLKLAVWGLAFKPGTDDVRESPAIDTIVSLAAQGVHLEVHDPQAMHPMQAFMTLPNTNYVKQPEEALVDADALLLLTEWEEYASISFTTMKYLLKRPVLFDGRQFWNPRQAREHGFIYQGIGRNMK